MPQSPHNRVAELHNLAAHAHEAAAAALGRSTHAHQQSKETLDSVKK